MAVHVSGKRGGLAGLQIAYDDVVSLIQEDPGAIDRGNWPQVRQKRSVLPKRRVENEINHKVRVAVETARVIDIETITKDPLAQVDA